MLGDLNSSLAVPLWQHGEPRGSLVTSDLSLNLPERSVRVPFSHFVCAILCSASAGTNSGDLPSTRPLPAQQVVLVGGRTMVVAARTKVAEGNGWKNWSYFIHDFLDMALWHRKRSSYELMVHHTCVISCFGLAVWSTMFVGYAVVALFVEVNSIFLHIRQLLNLTGVSKKEPKYRMNSMLNIGTFVVFRIAVLGWMTRWIVLHKDDLSLPVYTLGSVGLAIIMLMNIILFFRICIVDFSKKKHKDSKGRRSSPFLTVIQLIRSADALEEICVPPRLVLCNTVTYGARYTQNNNGVIFMEFH
ncbi:TLC domain-containing protein 2 [Portunus trituberculatus]|uniref:TLC domain-containing protein 2 n=1 Tax=Portunus trituberculatus TaxID=210409 RepID=A0A5B7DQR8_PORTR|nr:TLC domain-containing protein 2 [Portunus trituberculatus]